MMIVKFTIKLFDCNCKIILCVLYKFQLYFIAFKINQFFKYILNSINTNELLI